MRMGRRLLDTYEKWEQQGILKKRLKDVQDLVAKNITQKKIAEFLGMTEKTLIKLKKKHKRLEQAFIQGNDDQKDALINVIFKKAMGFKESTTQRTAENTKNAKNDKKGKVVITEKYYPPDLASAKFLLIGVSIVFINRLYNLSKVRIENKKTLDPTEKKE